MPNHKDRVERTCLGCGEVFFVIPSVVKYGMGKYHSRACYQASKLVPQAGRNCTVCGEYKVATEFDSNPQQRKRLRPECKACRRARARDYNTRNRAERRAYRILRQFGLTPAQYAALLERQGGGCAICHTTEPGNSFEFMPVDHNHTTGAVRGLLCATCNQGLGSFKDNPALLRAAITYLEVTDVSTGPGLCEPTHTSAQTPTYEGEPPGPAPG